MTADLFWNTIEAYNRQTWIFQAALMGALVFGFILSLKKRAQWFLKITLGVVHIFIGTVFFLYYGTEPIQHYFAAPLFLATGADDPWNNYKLYFIFVLILLLNMPDNLCLTHHNNTLHDHSS